MIMKHTVALLGLTFLIAVCDLVNPNRTNAEPVNKRPPIQTQVVASWYGPRFHGKPTKSGEVFNMYNLTAASNKLPMGTRVLLFNPKNNREVIVKITDTGGFAKYGRDIDISYEAAKRLGMVEEGVAVLRAYSL